MVDGLARASRPPPPMPADAHPTTPRPLIIVVWLSVPTRLSASPRAPVRLPRLHHARQVLEVHLVDDPRRRRHRATGGTPSAPAAGSGSRSPCARTRPRRSSTSAPAVPPSRPPCTLWSITRSTARAGSPAGVAAHPAAIASRIAARSTDARHAREVLEHDARRRERHLHGAGAFASHRREPEHVLLPHGEPSIRRSAASRITRSEYGRRSTRGAPAFSRADRRNRSTGPAGGRDRRAEPNGSWGFVMGVAGAPGREGGREPKAGPVPAGPPAPRAPTRGDRRRPPPAPGDATPCPGAVSVHARGSRDR